MLSGKYQDGIPKGSRFDLDGYEWLKDRYNSDIGQSRIKQVQQFKELIADLGCTPSQAAIAWCAQNNDVSTVILGSSSINQLKENLDSIRYIDLFSDNLLNKIDAIFKI